MESTIGTNTSKFCRFEVYKHSNNGLSGRIPTGRQLQTLADPSIYSNNQGLCGPPLRECANAIASTHSHTSQDDGRETLWLWLLDLALDSGYPEASYFAVKCGDMRSINMLTARRRRLQRRRQLHTDHTILDLTIDHFLLHFPKHSTTLSSSTNVHDQLFLKHIEWILSISVDYEMLAISVTPQVSAQQNCIYFMHHVLILLEKESYCKNLRVVV